MSEYADGFNDMRDALADGTHRPHGARNFKPITPQVVEGWKQAARDEIDWQWGKIVACERWLKALNHRPGCPLHDAMIGDEPWVAGDGGERYPTDDDCACALIAEVGR